MSTTKLLPLLFISAGCESISNVCEPECSAGYACSAGLCLPADQACEPSCSFGHTCQSGQCVPVQAATAPAEVIPAPAPVELPPTVAKEIVDLGTVSAGSSFEVEIPSGLLSFQLDAISDTNDLALFVEATTPRGAKFLDAANRDEYLRRIAPTTGIASIRYPFAPTETAEPGRYTFRIDSRRPTSTFRLRATWCRALGSALDANIFLIGHPNLNAANAQQHPGLTQTLETFRRIYASAGLTIRNVRFVDVSQQDAERFGVVESMEELDELFWLGSRYSNDDALNFYMIRMITFDAGAGVVLGVAGGVPGLASAANWPSRGVAVSAAFMDRDSWTVSTTMAHEGGHYLGLRHPNEREGTMFDLLTDTPECGADRDADRDGIVSYVECAGLGAENLMFWSDGSTAPPQVTPQQIEMARRSSSLL
ncbi:MAG: hypothetical protein HY791_37750 [Deltaproteobacteria bacterium]|nr:hypothetical protein [Deltaproteobacteria bacterium]